jgi:rfaE bifunctional protein kinase chain/domain
MVTLMNSNLRVLLVGDVMLDVYWDGAAYRISPEAPVPVLSVSGLRHRPGGASNVAVNLAALGSPVTLLAPLGEDDAAQRVKTMVEAEGVCFQSVTQEGYVTTQKIRCMSRSQQLLRADFEQMVPPPMLTALSRRFVELLPEHDIVVLSDYAKGALSECQGLIRLAREAGKPVLVDPKGKNYERYAGATLIKPNLAEFSSCMGEDIQDEAHFCRLGGALRRRLRVEHLLVTRGEDGMSLFNAKGVVHQPAQVREVYDVCGAGDTVLATITHMMALGEPVVEAMRWASAAASIVVGRSGTAQVSFQEVAEKLLNLPSCQSSSVHGWTTHTP